MALQSEIKWLKQENAKQDRDRIALHQYSIKLESQRMDQMSKLLQYDFQEKVCMHINRIHSQLKRIYNYVNFCRSANWRLNLMTVHLI